MKALSHYLQRSLKAIVSDLLRLAHCSAGVIMIRHLLTAPIHLHSRFHNTGVHYRETSRALGHREDKFLQANLRLFVSECPL